MGAGRTGTIETQQHDVESPPARTQFLIFTLFGDFILERGGEIWTLDLLHLMAVLGVSERAVRSALSRMARKGWLASRRKGRRSQYSLTRRGQILLEKGRGRIFEPAFTDWDGCWRLVLYSLPESMRAARHALRTQLTWLGYGCLAAGAWISLHDRFDELNNTLSELNLEPYIQLFSGEYTGPSSVEDLLHQCWDLEGLGEQYQDFIARYQQEYLDCLAQNAQGQALDPQFCFIRRFWLTHEFQSIPLVDPNLPTSLLPADWIGFTARQLFIKYHELLGAHAHTFVDSVLTK